MPRFYMAMKDAGGGDTLRGGAYKPLIRRFLNGETRMSKPHTLATVRVARAHPGK